jgi:uncharacterized surface protein with fasciclin (FAS1) repeats
MKVLNRITSIITAFLFILISAGLTTVMAQDNVVDVINNSDDHTIFAELLAETQLNGVIAEQGPFTVVAPTDAAFEAMGDEFEQMRANPEVMQNIVIGHLFQGEVSAEEAEPFLEIEIKEGDIPASNGIVHITDEVIQN